MTRLPRRGLLMAAAALPVAAAGPMTRPAAAGATRRLLAAPGEARLLGPEGPASAVWAYDGSIPGPTLRARQGEMLRVRLENRLPQPTTIHWHGIRLPNAMDGVGGVTQPPVPPGEGFDYAFALPDAGTHWYHPHWASHEQVARGLSGVLIVEEERPPPVDRDLLWVLGDWRVDRASGALAEGFGGMVDASHAGRVGNLVTLNGAAAPHVEPVAPGERLRLRLVNVANARVFTLRFQGLRPQVIALDGQPVPPHPPAEGGLVVLGPGMRADLILDCAGAPGERLAVRDEAYARFTYTLAELAHGPRRLRAGPPGAAPALPPNPLAEPDLATAETIPILLEGGMIGGMGMGMGGGGLRALLARGLAWTINGAAMAREHDHAQDTPLAVLRLGRSYVLDIRNDTAWPHPIHLHGHAFRVLTRDGAAVPHRPFRDTALLGARERMQVAFRADNAGDWMLHCHVLEHQHAGMAAVLRVA